MVKKSVIEYIRGLLQKGYDISTIRNTMLKYGYQNTDIDGALREIYNPTIRHEIHFSKTAFIGIFLIAISVIGISMFFYLSPPKAPSKLLDLSLEPVKTEANAGESISLIQQL